MKLEALFEGKQRLLKTMVSSDKTRQAKIYKDSEWEEIIVKFFENGKHQTKADYHTDDKEDAIGTAESWLKKSYEKK